METTYCFKPRIVHSLLVQAEPDIEWPASHEFWRALPCTDGFVTKTDLKQVDQSRKTSFRICHSRRALFISFECNNEGQIRQSPPNPRRPSRLQEGDFDAMEFHLDPKHNHIDFFRFRQDSNGGLRAWRSQKARCDREDQIEGTEWELKHGANLRISSRVNDKGWEGTMEIPFAEIGLEGGVMGFDTVRSFAGHPEQEIRHAIGFAGTPNTPLDFGDLYLNSAKWQVEEIDLDEPVYGGAPLRLTARTNSPEPDSANLVLAKRMFDPFGNRVHDTDDVIPVGADGPGIVFESTYCLDPKIRWPMQYTHAQRLKLTLKDRKTGEVHYAGSYPFSYKEFVKSHDAYGKLDGYPHPQTDDPEFMVKKHQWVVSRIPKFERVQNSENRGDCSLVSADGRYRFNLMESGILNKMTAMVEEIFETEYDRLAGITMFLHQRSVTRHSGDYGKPPAGTPLSIIRFGGGICGYRSPALSGLVTRMNSPRTGQPYFARIIELSGHTIVGVTDSESQPDEECMILDPDLGMFFYTADNQRLATLADMRADKSLAYRLHYNNFRYGYEMYHDPNCQHSHDYWLTGTWPQGAPEW